jgi:hypothetical protein
MALLALAIVEDACFLFVMNFFGLAAGTKALQEEIPSESSKIDDFTFMFQLMFI